MKAGGFSIRFPLALALSALFAVLAVRNVEFSNISDMLKRFDPMIFALGLAAYTAIPAVRAFRWRTLLLPFRHISPVSLFGYLCAGTLVNLAIPARAGELYRTWLVARNHRIALATSLGVAAVERLFDLGVLLAAFLVALSWIEPDATLATEFHVLPLIGLAILSLGLLALALFPSRARLVLKKLVEYLPSAWRVRIGNTLDKLLDGLATIRNARVFLASFVYTLIQRSLKFAFYFFALRAFGLELSVFETLLVMCAVAFSAAIPAVPTSLGVYHFAVMTALSLFGVSSTEALPVAVAMHLSEVVIDTGLGVASILLLHLPFRLNTIDSHVVKDES